VMSASVSRTGVSLVMEPPWLLRNARLAAQVRYKNSAVPLLTGGHHPRWGEPHTSRTRQAAQRSPASRPQGRTAGGGDLSLIGAAVLAVNPIGFLRRVDAVIAAGANRP
jgi:hypothetical protein